MHRSKERVQSAEFTGECLRPLHSRCRYEWRPGSAHPAPDASGEPAYCSIAMPVKAGGFFPHVLQDFDANERWQIRRGQEAIDDHR